MRVTAAFLSVLALGAASRVVSANGVRFVVPHGWHRVTPWGDASIDDPKTKLVVGTAGVVRRLSSCQITSYRVPAYGAVVVVVGWKKEGTTPNRSGRAPLRALRTVRRHTFECFAGRGAAVQVTLGGRVYQVNVMVGDRASRRVVAQALAVGRSFDLSR
jgi:hypothetical protein